MKKLLIFTACFSLAICTSNNVYAGHYNSPRKEDPLVTMLNIIALPIVLPLEIIECVTPFATGTCNIASVFPNYKPSQSYNTGAYKVYSNAQLAYHSQNYSKAKLEAPKRSFRRPD